MTCGLNTNFFFAKSALLLRLTGRQWSMREVLIWEKNGVLIYNGFSLNRNTVGTVGAREDDSLKEYVGFWCVFFFFS